MQNIWIVIAFYYQSITKIVVTILKVPNTAELSLAASTLIKSELVLNSW